MTLKHIQEVSVSRAQRWHKQGIEEWSALEWAGAMAGEAGEACNAAKKLRRIELELANINYEEGRHLDTLEKAKAAIGREVADTILYAVLLAARVGIAIEPVLQDVFNKKSIEYDFPERL